MLWNWLAKQNLIAVLLDLMCRKTHHLLRLKMKAKFPKKYFIPQPAMLDKKTILLELKSGNEVTGASMKQTASLRIR